MPSGTSGSRSYFWSGFGFTLFVFVSGGALGIALAKAVLPDRQKPPSAESRSSAAAAAPYVDHGNGIYEFPSINVAFTHSVVAFLNEEKNAGLHCHLLADTYGQDSRWTQMVTGHLLQCHDTSVYAQSETVP